MPPKRATYWHILKGLPVWRNRLVKVCGVNCYLAKLASGYIIPRPECAIRIAIYYAATYQASHSIVVGTAGRHVAELDGAGRRRRRWRNCGLGGDSRGGRKRTGRGSGISSVSGRGN